MARNVSATAEIKGVLHLGVAESLCYYLLPQILETFKKQFPLVSFKILFGDALTLPTMLQNNDIDLGLSLSTLITKKEILILSKHSAHLDLLVQPNHPLSNVSHLTLKDLEPYPFFLTEKGCSYRSELLRVLNQYNVFPTIELETNSKEILKRFTMHSMGITFLPELTVLEEIKAHKLIPLDWSCEPFDIWLQLLIHKDKPINPLLQTFIDYFIEILSQTSI